MPIDMDYVVAENAIRKLSNKLRNTPHGKRDRISHAIVAAVNDLCEENNEPKEI